jgi:hypothetical protein
VLFHRQSLSRPGAAGESAPVATAACRGDAGGASGARRNQRGAAGEDRPESRRQPDQRSVPEQYQSRRRSEEGHPGRAQHPAGDPGVGQRRLERHHPHDPADHPAAGNGVRRKRHHRHRQPAIQRIPVAGEAGRTDLGRRRRCPGADEQQFQARQRQLGSGADVRRAAFGVGQSLGVRRPGQQHLVIEQQRDGRRLQRWIDPAVHQLQHEEWPVPDQLADPDRELEGDRERAMDRSARRRHRQDLSSGQASGEHPAIGVLQRRQARLRAELAASSPSSIHVSEVLSHVVHLV